MWAALLGSRVLSISACRLEPEKEKQSKLTLLNETCALKTFPLFSSSSHSTAHRFQGYSVVVRHLRNVRSGPSQRSLAPTWHLVSPSLTGPLCCVTD